MFQNDSIILPAMNCVMFISCPSSDGIGPVRSLPSIPNISDFIFKKIEKNDLAGSIEQTRVLQLDILLGLTDI